jgi:hypothetical protein
VGLANVGSESETCVGSRVHLVGVSISFEKNFYRLPFTPPLSGSPYWSFISITTDEKIDAMIDAVKTTTIVMTTIAKS